MRHGVAALCLLAAACTSENELRYTATLNATTRGVVLSEDGLDATAAMIGTTCTIDTNWGCPTADEDLPTADERIVDHYRGRTLGASREGLHTLTNGRWAPEDDVPLAGMVRTAALLEAGTLILGGDDRDCWLQRADGAAVAVADEACDEGARYAVDRSGRLFVTTSSGVLALDERGSRPVADTGDLVAWDAALQRLYTAWQGEERLWAVDTDGQRLWEARAGGPIRSIATRGDRGEVLVVIERGDGLAGLERRSGEDGKLLGRSVLPTADGDLKVSDNGTTVAIVRPMEVAFFSLLTEGEDPVRDPTPPVCIDPLARNQFD